MTDTFHNRNSTEIMADFLRSKGFLPGGEVVIDGESWTAEDLAAIATGPVEWGETT